MPIQTVSQAFSNEGVGGFSFRNKIINGAMEIDQRNAGAEVNPATHNGYQLDRWTTFMDVSNKFKVQQLTTSPPAGFTHYMRLTVTNAYTSSSGERFALNQKIEGYNLIDTEYGLGTAKPMTLSFWVRSSLTGTFGGTIHSESATSYYFPFSYTISSANTWEKKTVSILPFTLSTPNSRTTGNGMRVWFDLGSGDTQAAGAWSTTAAYTATGAQKWLSNAGATLDFTGVQLEIGNQATPFERRPYGLELQLCQRYFQTYGNGVNGTTGDNCIGTGMFYTAGELIVTAEFKVIMRAVPTYSCTTVTDGFRYHRAGANTRVNTLPYAGVASTSAAIFGSLSIPVNGVAGYATQIFAELSGAKISFSAEL